MLYLAEPHPSPKFVCVGMSSWCIALAVETRTNTNIPNFDGGRGRYLGLLGGFDMCLCPILAALVGARVRSPKYEM